VETVQPSAPRAPQAVSMPRNNQPSPAPIPARTVVTAPRESSRQNNHHENKGESRHEEKSDHKQNR
jgi:hypothetical protein